MVNVGCVAKLLSNLHMGTCYWVKRVNPYWYEAREVPKTLLSKKIVETAVNLNANSKRKTKKLPKHNYSPLARQHIRP